MIARFEIVDPCSCLDNATIIDLDAGTGGDDGQFSEVVLISNANGTLPSGQIWTVVDVTSGAFDAFNVPPVGMQSAGVPVATDGSVTLAYEVEGGYYELPFVHIDEQGYTMTIEGPFAQGSPANVVLTISNNCQYPNPVFDPIVPDTILTNDGVISLGGMDTNGVGADGVSFTIDGMSATEIDPGVLPEGVYTLVMTYDGSDDGNGGVSPDGGTTPASPGCIQEVQQVFEIVPCSLEVDCSNIVDQTLACRSDLPSVDFSLPIVVDSCGDVIRSALTIIPGNSGCPEDTLRISRTYFLQDNLGNMAECMQTFTIISQQDPMFTFVPQDTTILCTDSSSPADLGAATGVGECDPSSPQATISFTDTDLPSSCPGESRILRTWTVTDRCGRSVDSIQQITLIDIVGPVPICTGVTVYLDGNGEASITPNDILVSITDNCSGVESLSLDQSTFTCIDLGINEVTLTAVDSCGNVSMCQNTVTVLDTISPSCMVNDITVYVDEMGMASLLPRDLDITTMDNCGVVDTVLSRSQFSCEDLGDVSITVTVGDASMNTSTCDLTVTVQDTVPPVAVCEDVTVFLDGNGQASIGGSGMLPAGNVYMLSNNVQQFPADLVATVCGDSPTPTAVCDCPSGYVVTGYEGLVSTNYGGLIGEFTLICRELLANGSLGSTSLMTCSNGNANTSTMLGPFETSGDNVMVGVMTQYGMCNGSPGRICGFDVNSIGGRKQCCE
jgi:hypothetical protein